MQFGNHPRMSVWSRIFVTVLVIGWASSLVAQPAASSAGRFEQQTFRDDDGDHQYTVYLPSGFRTDRKYPVILFLHGAGERGKDGKKQLTVGLAPYLKAKAASYPFVVVFPQCEDMEGQLLSNWTAGTADANRALKILDEVQAKFPTDPKRTVLMGWSMGGYGAWSLGAAHPERWSAVVALSGGANPETVAKLKDTPVWAFHGAKDKIVPVVESRAAVDALKAAGGNVTYTEFPEAGHAPFEETLGNDGLIRWMLDPQTAPAQLAKQPARSQPLVPAPPFVPVVEVPQAVGVRLGNEALNAFSYAAPKLVPTNMLSGRIGDMYDSTSAAGRQFSVTFSGISYHGHLDRVQIKAFAKDRLGVQLGLTNIVMTIGGTYVSGARHSAQAGPINIGIGHSRPVWLGLDVTPTVANRRIQLRLNGVNFQIPPDNFYVTQPAGVSVRGFGMTQERVSSGLVSGLYGSRSRIENEVRNIAPSIVRQMEQQLNLAVDVSTMISGLWPLPVYEPQVRAWPESIQTDADGVTLIAGITAASPDPFGPAKPLRTAAPLNLSATELGQGKALRVALAPQIVGPLTNLLIDDNLGVINVLDIPEKSFARLAERDELTKIIPDLARYGDSLQTRTVLRLGAPMNCGAASSDLELQIPKLLVSVAINTDPAQPEWKHCAEFELEVRQQIDPSLNKPTFARREVQLGFKPGETISGGGRFAEGYAAENSTIHSDQFVELFRDSWSKWTQNGSKTEANVPDVAFGNVKLRVNDLDWAAPVLVADFKPAGIKITNLSDEPFTYEARGPHSGYGGPYTLPPGKSHEFDIPYPLTYRHRGKSGMEVYTLTAGLHSEYRVPAAGGPPRLFQAKTP